MPQAPFDNTCLTALVGISAAGSDCFPLPPDPEAAAALTASATGFYLDQVEGLSFRVSNGNPKSDLYARLRRARELAALRIRTALQGRAALGAARYERRGVLGKPGNGQALPALTLARLTLQTVVRDFGAYRISTVRLDATATVAAVPLLLDGQPVGTLTSTNAPAQAVAGILIPLDGQPHTLEALLPEGVRPLDTKLFCPPCSGGGPWGQSVAASLSGITTATSSFGFTLSVAEECTAPGAADGLCYAVSEYPELQLYVAQALLYQAAELMVVDLLADASVSRYTMLEPKTLPALGARYADLVQQHLRWLTSAAGLGRVQHPCFVCTPSGWHPTTTVTR
ncbi:hypothetical protein BEN47_06115 [Hymenobacter lapidarius]|uniref:Uncharacterized protein n=1 Tax=Hymenobacter lapidarius TaxID=1908237 RepID=A0A1G1SQD4_9BACT|nr:hypothetical protein [Hymenobacter lapidarius]OGX80829.1 hypothetical protein BEN47_06115 [Hymenobacter lapidarius]